MIERSHLRIVREIQKGGSLTTAAKSLHLTQSALSHSIKKLEDQLGTPLWQKDGRKLRLTQAGECLLEQANRILPQLESTDDMLQRFASSSLGTLRIGMECHPCYQWILTKVRRFLDEWPGVDVDVKLEFQFGGMNALKNYEIDLLVTPDPFHSEDALFTPVFAYEQVAVVPNQHPFASKGYLKPEDFSDQTLYTYPVAVDRLDIFALFLLPQNCRPKVHKTADATEIMLQLVDANRGIATLPKWLVEEHSSQFAVAPVRLGKQGIHKHIHLGMRKQEKGNNLAKAFIELATSK